MRFTKTRMTKSFILLEIFHTASEILSLQGKLSDATEG